MRKHDCGVALYPPPEVGGFTATKDKELNALLNHTDEINWEQYLGFVSAEKLINQALQKMPVFEGVVVRTLKLHQKAIDNYKVGENITLRGLTSSTYGDEIKIEDDVNVILTIHSKQGRLIERVSRFEHEKEVLFKSFSQFEVKQVIKDVNTYKIELKEL